MNDDKKAAKAAKAKLEAALRKAMKEEAERARVKPGLAKILRKTTWKVKRDKKK